MIANRSKPFGDRLAALVEERESQLILGLDPDPARLWPGAVEAVGSDSNEPPIEMAAHAVALHCGEVIAAVADQCVGVKLQLACFERLGAPGWRALERAVAIAREHGLLVIADGKRGDVPVSATVYAAGLFGGTDTPWGVVEGLGADAATVNPLTGADSVTPFVAAAADAGCGVFALVRTSNPGAADIEDLNVEGGGSVSDRLAALVRDLGSESIGASGLSVLGAVVGATAPEHIRRLREAMPAAVLLIPGVGAQGGRVEDLEPAFGAGRASALVTVSRALVDAGAEDGADRAAAARRTAAELRESIWSASAI